jgi:hypothetical protein
MHRLSQFLQKVPVFLVLTRNGSIKRTVWPGVLCIVLAIGSASTGCSALRSSTQSASEAFSFALIGDMPYLPQDDVKFERLMDDLNADASLAWIMHAGDVKTGASPCSDEYLEHRLAMLQQFKHPLVYTPGDNEWADCHRDTAGGFQPLERLARLRGLFFSESDHSLGQPAMPLASQATESAHAEFAENTRWVHGNIVFATLHIVGSQNANAPFPGRTAADDAEAARRMEAALAWLHGAFQEAAARQSTGVFLMIHANPFLDARPESPFRPFLLALEEAVLQFGNPVVLVHGDSHYFRIDKPLVSSLSGRHIEQFTRVETFGSADVHWVRVTVHPAEAQPFTFNPQLVEANFEPHTLPTR